MKIDCISDLHGHYPKLEGGDLLIVAGDLTAKDTSQELKCFLDWLEDQKYDRLIFIAGNHDNQLRGWFTTEESENMMTNDEFHKWEYLKDSGTEFAGLKIWGSPWTKRFEGMNPHCMAFTVDTEEELYEKWKLIPDDIDILVTHGPPIGILDTNIFGEECGSYTLKKQMWNRQEPLKLHVFGHIHESYGKYLDTCYEYSQDECDQVFVNASHVNERYEPVNKPVRVIL